MNFEQLLEYVVKPANQLLGVDSLAAQQLVIGTAAVESGGEYIRQLNNGPARGFFQMEPNTHEDIWINYLAYRDKYKEVAESLLSGTESLFLSDENNLDYAFDVIANQ